MIENLKLSIEVGSFPNEFFYYDTNISGNFNTEHPYFEHLAYFLAEDNRLNRQYPKSNLDLLEKLEILCKKAREICEHNKNKDGDYREVKAIQWNDKVFFENKKPIKFYDEITCLKADLYLVSIGRKRGLITCTKELLPVEYDWIGRLCDSFIYSKIEEKVTIYNLQCELVLDNLEVCMHQINPFRDDKNYIWAKREGKWGLFDSDMNPLIPFSFEYDECEIVYNEDKNDLYIKVYKDDKCRLINGVLNIEIVHLEEEIEDIYDFRKEYVITFKADHKNLNFSRQDILNIENEFKKQN